MSFPRFAYNNVTRNGRAYLAYFVSSAFMVMIFFTYAVFYYHPEIGSSPLGEMSKAGVRVGAIIVYIFAVLFVLYSISVFLKSRNREFGLLTILGARAGQINALIFLENMIIGLFSVVTGIAAGLLLAKLFLLICMRMVGIDELPFYWPTKAIALTAGSFAALFLFVSVFTLLFIRRNRVLELLTGTSKPRPAPKPSIPFAALGIALLAVGFYMVYYAELSPVSIFTAAGTGIAGTYFFYSQLSGIAVRLLKRSRKLTWRGTNLLWMSEIVYKVKDNARMLFMVTVVTSIACMAAGFVIAINKEGEYHYRNNPFALSLTVYDEKNAEADLQRIRTGLREAEKDYEEIVIRSIFVNFSSDDEYVGINVIPLADYAQIVDLPSLPESATPQTPFVFRKSTREDNSATRGATLNLFNYADPIRPTAVIEVGKLQGMPTFGHALIVDDAMYEQIRKVEKQQQREQYYFYVPIWNTGELPGAESEENKVGLSIRDAIDKAETNNYLVSRSVYYYEGMQGVSLFSFIGLFIAMIFSVSSASFFYFKLNSDLAADRRSYAAMSKIGLSVTEMNRSASVQIALLFFVPIGVSALQTFTVLRPLLREMNVVTVNTPVLYASLSFLAAQIVYYLLVRGRYVAALRKLMV